MNNLNKIIGKGADMQNIADRIFYAYRNQLNHQLLYKLRSILFIENRRFLSNLPNTK